LFVDDYVSITDLLLTIGALDNSMIGTYPISLYVVYHNCSNSNSKLDFMLTVVCDSYNGPLPLSLLSTTDTDFDYNFFDDTTIDTKLTYSHHVCGSPSIKIVD
jgi:hypothetical protein